MTPRLIFIVISALLCAGLGYWANLWAPALWGFLLVLPPVILGIYDIIQKKSTLLRIYPVIGHARYLLEEIRPEIQQYFIESNLDGMPFDREHRSLVYQRAKGQTDKLPFGTQRDVERAGYEWMHHSIDPKSSQKIEPRVLIGGKDCTQPYAVSHLNVSAMSFGSLGANAIRALNLGAKAGGFYHNTGEGAISAHHEHGGDLVWQIGTGYFGCRQPDGSFDAEKFREKAMQDNVKMIEIKLSQGAKPGHGGILPAAKITPEIAEIRGVDLGQEVVSPSGHKSIKSPRQLLDFVIRLRELSGGKPVGFKLCVGYRSEFLGICKAMAESGNLPDFITVDGGEGGTGAAPVELSNSVGMPLRDGLIFVDNSLRGFGLRRKITVIASGKIVTGFHIVRALALGADICNSARGMMFALGCIQARRCHTNDCPVGVATQDTSRNRWLDVPDKAQRVARFQSATIRDFLGLLAAAGLDHPGQVRPLHVWRRVQGFTVKHFGELYPVLDEGDLLDPKTVPEDWRMAWDVANPDNFQPYDRLESRGKVMASSLPGSTK